MSEQLSYFDANVLVYRAQAAIPTYSGMGARVGPLVQALMADDERTAVTSDLGFLELRNTLAKICRTTEPELSMFDASWMSDSITQLMRDVDEGRLEVLTTRPQTSQQASALVDLAARNGRAFGTWDTVHVITAATLAWNRLTTVEIVTADKGFGRFLDVYPHFGRFVRVLEIEDPQK